MKMAEKREKNYRKLSKLETRKLSEIRSRKLAYHLGKHNIMKLYENL